MTGEKQQILEVSLPFIEAERKYNLENVRALRKIFAYIRKHSDVFVTLGDALFLDPLPPVCNMDFEAPLEVTPPRKRIYYDTAGLSAYENNIEIRQEIKTYGVKQVIKIGDGAREDEPTLIRPEYPCKLSCEGVNLKGIVERDTRKKVKNALKKEILHPIISIVSQRARFTYHPHGIKDIEIELGFDQLCGQTFNGYAWAGFQLEMEIKSGPTNPKEIDQVLNRQEDLIFAETNTKLSRELKSKPYPGYAHLKENATEKELLGRLA